MAGEDELRLAVREALDALGVGLLSRPRELAAAVSDLHADPDAPEVIVLGLHCTDALLRPFSDAAAQGAPEALESSAARAERYLHARRRVDASDARSVAWGLARGIADHLGLPGLAGPAGGGGSGSGEGRDGPLSPERGADVAASVSVSAADAAGGSGARVRFVLPSTGERQSLLVDVPAGTVDGAVVRVTGCGDYGANGGPRGDLLLTVRVAPVPRRGGDAMVDLDVTAREARDGVTRLVTYPVDAATGETGSASVRVPVGTADGAVLRFRGLGMRGADGGEPGDLVVRVRVRGGGSVRLALAAVAAVVVVAVAAFASGLLSGIRVAGVPVRDGIAGYSWEELKSISGAIAGAPSDEDGLEVAREYNLVGADGRLRGDTKPVTLADGTETSVRILGFRHDELASGGLAGITFEFADVPAKHETNSVWNYEGGWEDSEMRSWLNSDFLELLPDDMRKHVETTLKWTNNAGKVVDLSDTSVVTATSDRLWLLSETEVYGHKPDNWNVSIELEMEYALYYTEGTQYQLYVDQGVTYESYEFCKKDGADLDWLLRTPHPRYSGNFNRVNHDGDWNYATGGLSTCGASPGFCF